MLVGVDEKVELCFLKRIATAAALITQLGNTKRGRYGVSTNVADH